MKEKCICGSKEDTRLKLLDLNRPDWTTVVSVLFAAYGAGDSDSWRVLCVKKIRSSKPPVNVWEGK